MPNLPWKEAIVQVLRGAGTAMHYADIADEIVNQQLRQEVGATPANTVSVIINNDMRNNGDGSLFVRVSPGVYLLRASVVNAEGVQAPIEDAEEEEIEEAPSGIINAYGMYWRRDWVLWGQTTKLLGQQQAGASQVDFANQKGVYLLHDEQRVVYAGRTTDQPLGRRLFQHTFDRLSGRWSRFSWFGVMKVNPNGELAEPDLAGLDIEHWITTMEALLIEGLEPPQNRKRGDDFRAVEYLQVEDPQIQRRNLRNLLQEIQNRIDTE